MDSPRNHNYQQAGYNIHASHQMKHLLTAIDVEKQIAVFMNIRSTLQ